MSLQDQNTLLTCKHLLSQESPYQRTYFYVGGQYVDDGKGNGRHVLQGQLYVEQLTPVDGIRRPWPVVLIHGGGQTGTNFLNTPDGRKGWASWLIDQGYQVFLIDQIDRGRSAWQPKNDSMACLTTEFVEEYFTACSDFGSWPQAKHHTQWPGSGRMSDEIFDAYFASTIQSHTTTTAEQVGMRAAGACLLDRIGPAVLIAHSSGAPHAWLWADVRPWLVKGIVAIEPMGPPFDRRRSRGQGWDPYGITDLPLTYDPPIDTADGRPPLDTELHSSPGKDLWQCVLQKEPARKLVNLSNFPVLIETGEASYHAEYDHCTVSFLKQAGVTVEHLQLKDVGIHGNGHMQFMELNNLEIIAVLEKWIVKL